MHVFDDFREAYSWLRHNTPEDAKVSSSKSETARRAIVKEQMGRLMG